MRSMGNRTIKVKKSDLINTLKKNQKKHIKQFGKAVVAYKREVSKQLNKLHEKNEKGELDIRLDLVKPVNKQKNYTKIIEMFDWELDDEVELSQDEFKEYVQDEFGFAIQARLSNSTYLG